MQAYTVTFLTAFLCVCLETLTDIIFNCKSLEVDTEDSGEHVLKEHFEQQVSIATQSFIVIP